MSIAHLLYGTLLLGCVLLALRLWQQQRAPYLMFLALMIIGLTYDNFVIGLGRFIGEGELLRSLNIPRYLLHAFFTPLMIMVGLFLARNAGIAWARSQRSLYIFGGITTAMILLGGYVDVLNLDLVFEHRFDTMRYANDFAVGPPIPAIIAIILLIVCGVAIFRQTRWVWLAAGAVAMFIASAGGSAFGVFTNLGELALAASMLVTAKRFPYESLADSAETALDPTLA